MSMPMKWNGAGFYNDLPDAQYHADKLAPDGSLSSTLARLLTQHVPAKAIERRKHSKPTRAMNLGTAAHRHALGAGPQLIVWQYDGRTKDGKAERADVADLIATDVAVAVTEDERTQITGMVVALRAHPEVLQVLESSQSEVSAFWQEGLVWLRARYDLLGDLAYDYKTAQDVSRRGFARSMASYGYHQQADFYERGLTALNHPAAGKPMRFICQEVEPPYLVQIHTPDEEAREVARMLNDRAIAIFAACTTSGVWPEYDSLDAEPAALPSFYFFDNAEVLPDTWRPLEQDMVI